MEKVKLGDICDIQSGGTPRRSVKDYWDNGNIPWVKISDIENPIVESTEEKITEEGLKNSSAKLFSKGTILYTIFATLGEVGILGIDATTNQAIAGIKLQDDRFTNKYLYYYLLSRKQYVNHIGRGVAQNNINLTVLRNFEVPVVPIEDQESICKELDILESLLSLKEQQREALDTLIKSRFVEMFRNLEIEGNELPLSQCLSSVTGGGTPSMRHEEYYGGDIPFIKSGDVKSDWISTGALSLTETALNKTNVKMVPQNTLIVVVRSAALLREFHIGIAKNPLVINQDLKALTPKDNFNPLYLMWAIRMKEQIILGKVQTMLTSHIRMEDFLNLSIPNAEQGMQNQFAEFVQQVDQAKQSVSASIETLQTLKASLMQKYFH